EKDKSGTHLGETVNYQGKALNTYVKTDDDGHPTEAGFTIPETVFNSFDALSSDVSWSLDFPTTDNETPFLHLYAGFNPHGHEPMGIYDKPHFDFHFYTTSEAERLAISPVDTVKGAKPLPAGEVPATYFNAGLVPEMGSHWIDGTAPELNGGTFTETFIFGSFDGKMTFYEPMITKAFIEAKQNFTKNIPAVTAFGKAGKYYPTKFGFRHDEAAKTYQFFVSDFVKR
ncbi:MAG: hypothetical protein L6Q97_15645, partial [Thermoanaerobaculia bacterium]|nr:hypothetical protein [Thermoanaerobaculia bacterium]